MISLTVISAGAILKPLSKKTKARSQPEKQWRQTPIQGVFYCPQKLITDLIRPFVLVARNGQPKGWPVSIARYCEPVTRRRPTARSRWRRFTQLSQWSHRYV